MVSVVEGVILHRGCWAAPAGKAAAARSGDPILVCRAAPPVLPAQTAVSPFSYGDGSGPPRWPRRGSSCRQREVAPAGHGGPTQQRGWLNAATRGVSGVPLE